MAHNLCPCHPGTGRRSHFELRKSPLLTPLHIAVCNGRLGTAKLLLSRGAGIQGHQPSPYSHTWGTGTILHTAARNNDAATICFLLENRLVDVDSSDSLGYTALHFACLHHGELHAMKALFLHAADPNAEADDYQTPFTVACSNGYFNACLLLLESGGPELDYGLHFGNDDEDDVEDSPCHIAVKPMSNFFALKRNPPPDPDTWESDRGALLRQLVDGSRLDLFVSITNFQDQTPLHNAARLVSPVGVVQCLLDNDAEVDAQDQRGCTPLRLLLERGDLHLISAIADLLLRRGARLDIRCSGGLDALHGAFVAARRNTDYAVVNFVLQHASDANFNNESGRRSKNGQLSEMLITSHQEGCYAECRVLMQHGARLDLDKSRLMRLLETSLKSPVCVEQVLFYLDMFPNLVTANDAMRIVLQGGRSQYDGRSIAKVTRLLFARPDFRLDPQTNQTTTLLHSACTMRPVLLDVVQRLLDMGSNPNLFDERFRLPLSRSMDEDCLHLTKILLEHGADPFIRPSAEEWIGYVARVNDPVYRYSSYPYFLSTVEEKYRTPFEIALTHTTFLRPAGCHYTNNISTDSVSASTVLSLILEHHELPALPAEPSALSYMHSALFNEASLDTLLSKGADPNSGKHCTNPPLMHAVQQQQGTRKIFRVVKRLLKYGANVHQKNEEGQCFVDVMKEASLARAQNPDELAEFKDSDGKFALQCMLLYHCHLTVDAASGEDTVKVLTHEETLADLEAKDWRRRQHAWLKLQGEEKARQKARQEKERGIAARKRLREQQRKEQRRNPRSSLRLAVAECKKRGNKS